MPRSAAILPPASSTRLRVWLATLLLPAAHVPAGGQVVLNEIMANGTDRQLRWSAAGVPRVGFGVPWPATDYDDSTWPAGPGPFGFGSFANVSPAPTIGTNTASQMRNLTPTLYLRRTFTASQADAARSEPLQLDVRFNDGFVCYLNGTEVARRNAGPPDGFVYHDQPAASGTPANAEPSTSLHLRLQSIQLGPANSRLVAGTNVLAIHALNHLANTSAHNTSNNSAVTITNSTNFYLSADLRIAATTPVTLVSNTSSWRYLPGLLEPSAGVDDPALLFQARQRVPWGGGAFDDSGWTAGAAPFAAGNPPAGVTPGTNLTAQLPGHSTSLYLRTVFNATAADLADPRGLQLTIDWDDGFVAYLNGTEVARDRLAEPNAFTPHNAVATSARTPGTTSVFEFDPPARLLDEGQNVLAVQLHNVSLADADLFVRARLHTNTAGTNRTLVADTAGWRYFIGTEEPLPPDDESLEDNPEPPEASFDWLELHNPGAGAVSLDGWHLSDTPADTRRWAFSAGTSIPAGGFLVVACDGLDITAPGPGGMLHTNFKLASAGESALLADPSGAIVQQLDFGPQSPFHSLGRDATGAWRILDPPSPGAANAGATLTGQAAPVTFTPPAGFHNGSRAVTLATTTPGATIRYTTDGSEPTESTGTAATSTTVTSSRTLRARAFLAGMLPSPVATATYLINEPAARQSLPALCLAGDERRALYRPFGVMAISGGAYPAFTTPAPTTWNGQWVQTAGSVGSAADLAAYNHPIHLGRCLERPVNLELLRANGTPGPNLQCGLRISGSGHARPRYRLTNQNRTPGIPPGPNDGAWSATDFTQKPSFNIYFRADLGGDPLEWPLFAGSPVAAFHDLRLRAGKNDVSNPFVEDEFMRRTFVATGQAGSHGSINTLYVNGVYKGYFNLCEHLREDFMQRHHGSTRAWDVRQVTSIASGDGLAFQEMVTFAQNNPQATLANYQSMRGRLDMVNFIDYLLVNLLGVTGDWPHNNYVAARERATGALHRFYVWDAEGAFGDFSGNVRTNMFQTGTTGSIVSASPATAGINEAIRILYTQLRASAEFRLLFADRIQRHFFNNGALTEARLLAAWNALKGELAPLVAPAAVTDKVTPWLNGVGDPTRYTTNGTTTVNAPSRRNVLFNGYTDDPAGGSQVAAHLVAEGLWPATRAPQFSQHGGTVAPGFNLTLTNPNGAGFIYFTTDGTDPRAEGGLPVGSTYSAPLPILQPLTVKARVRNTNREWSPLTEAFFDPGTVEPLLLTEIMYHPPDLGAVDGDQYEFLEIKNTGPNSLHLGGMAFTAGINYTFPPGIMLGPGQFVVLARSAARFTEKYPGLTPTGEWGAADALDNAGATLALANLAGRTVFQVPFGDDPPWPTSPDGAGPSLVPVQPNLNPAPAEPASWRASSLLGGSPGADDPPPVVPEILITEILANTPPGGLDRLELHNPNAFPVDVSYWWLSDNIGTPQKFRIPPGTSIPADGYATFSEADFATGPLPFAFSRTGEQARLSSSDITGTLTGYAHAVDFGASNPGESHGRHLNSQGVAFFTALAAPTLGAPNSPPRVGPLVISELMYYPPAGGDEFLELRNVSSAPVSLFDPANPSNTWKVDGAGWTFPAGVTLPPGGFLLLSNLAPETFRTKYQIPAAIPVHGGYTGNLSNGGESIALQMPGEPYQNDAGQTVVPYIDVDRVSYGTTAPWPASPAGSGPSLERVNPLAFANDPANWQAAATTGGSLGTPPPRSFETWRSLAFTPAQLGDPAISAPTADPDHDDLCNLLEWAYGFDPWTGNTTPVSYRIAPVGNQPTLEVSVRISRAASGLALFADTSPDLYTWHLGTGIQTGPPVDQGDGTEILTFRPPSTAQSAPCHFLRFRFTTP